MARSLNILLAEDDPDDVVFIRRAFEKSGSRYNLIHVSNGEQAVDYLHGEGQYRDRDRYPFPDLLLLDLKMPMMDGFDVLAWIRQQPRERKPPVVVLTGSNQDCDVQLARELGAIDYQIKSQDLEVLATLVENLETRWLRQVTNSCR